MGASHPAVAGSDRSRQGGNELAGTLSVGADSGLNQPHPRVRGVVLEARAAEARARLVFANYASTVAGTPHARLFGDRHSMVGLSKQQLPWP